MAPTKRKVAREPSARESKRVKPSNPDPDPSQMAAVPSEGAAFRRGGAEVLTPLERRQIHNQAQQDVLMEQDPHKSREQNLIYDGKGVSVQDALELIPTRGGRKRTSTSAKGVSRLSKAIGVPEQLTRIEGLTYKKLVTGSLLLGQITKIRRQEITLALPNNLFGFVHMSPILAGTAPELNQQDESSSEEGSERQEDSGHRFDAKDYFNVGQYLRAVVKSSGNSDGSQSGSKKHIELSILPKDVNVGLALENVAVNTILQAEVVSVEDHGLIMNIGFANARAKGFVAADELDPNNGLSRIRPGTIMLCLVIDLTPESKIIKLSSKPERLSNLKASLSSKNFSTIDTLLPGTAIEFSISDFTAKGLRGNAMGLVEVTADLIHSGQLSSDASEVQKFKLGMKMKGRIIWAILDSEAMGIGISILQHIVTLSRPKMPDHDMDATPTDLLPISRIKDDMKVKKVQPGVGVLMDVGTPNIYGFAHISKLSDEKIRDISEESGRFKVGSVHRGRVMGYNPIDGLFTLSLEPRVLELPFLYLEDIQLGQKITGTVEKLLLHANGVSGVIMKLTDNVTGLVPETHFADVTLQLPERKFKIGSEMITRVLSVDLMKRRVRLTCKKTLINDSSPIWRTHTELSPGMRSSGTIKSLKSSGAILEFYGPVKGFLPVSEMSESLVKDPHEHFRVGQVLSVRLISVDPLSERLLLSCKESTAPNSAGVDSQETLAIGSRVEGRITEKLPNDVVVELEGTNTKAILPFGHLLDTSHQDCLTTARRLRVGQTLRNLMVIGTGRGRRHAKLTSKQSLSKAMDAGSIPTSFEDVIIGADVVGYVKNITSLGIFVQFANDLTGLLLKSQISDDKAKLPDFGTQRDQTVHARAMSMDTEQQRFLLTQKKATKDHSLQSSGPKSSSVRQVLTNVVDGVSLSIDDYILGKVTKARIKSVKDTQLNVELADDVQGRIDISQVFVSWDDIKDRKRPLRSFKAGQVLSVRVLGIHDAKNHRFLPITHSRTRPVFELSAKLVTQEVSLPKLDQIQLGSSWLCFVNNITRDYLWVNLAPNLRGRIRVLDISNNPSVLNNLSEHFPVGSAVRARAANVDLTHGRLDLIAKSEYETTPKHPEEFRKGDSVIGKVLSHTNMLVKIQLSETILGLLYITDMEDDFSKTDPSLFKEDLFLTVCVLGFDEENRKLILSSRPSRISASLLPVVDQELNTISQLQVNHVARGFIKNVTDKGIFVSLSRNLTAFVRVSDLSDNFIKNWQVRFKFGQLVKGKVVELDFTQVQIRMSLKDSALSSDYQPPLSWNDLKEGQILNGKVRKAESFGVFVVFDNSLNISGLCHRSEMADEPIADARLLYQEGDSVKVKVLTVDQESRRVSLGMKTSYINLKSADVQHNSSVPISHEEDKSQRIKGSITTSEGEPGPTDVMQPMKFNATNGETSPNLDAELDVGGFEWTEAPALQESDHGFFPGLHNKKEEWPRKGRTTFQVDKTAALGLKDAQSHSDYERLLINQPGSSLIWLNYMSFHLQLGEVGKAREVAERAVRIITTQSKDSDEEILDIWIGFLNLELTYGDEDSLKHIFSRACQCNDPKELHHRLTSIYIKSGNHHVCEKNRHVFMMTNDS